MKKSIYTYYKERLIEISGNNKCLYLNGAARKGIYDIGRILEGRSDKVAQFVNFLWKGGRGSFTLISSKEKKAILENLDIQSRFEKKQLDTTSLIGEALVKASQKNEKIKREEMGKAIEAEISKIKDIKRTVEEFEKETGRSELYIGYPFVFGSISEGSKKVLIKAPLLLFPIKIEVPDENTVEIFINRAEKIQFNKALIFAYAQSKKLHIDSMDLEFDDLERFPNASSVIKYLEGYSIRFDGSDYESKNIYNYDRFKEPTPGASLSVRYASILTRFPLSNSIFNDYSVLEKKQLTNDAITELLRVGRLKKQKKARNQKVNKNIYNVKMLDFAQSDVLKKVDEAGNMVIYGPPGTGKSQTIVNIITNAISKNKRVLVVSQKRAALDVVYNRLGNLNDKLIYITDEVRERKDFYEKCLSAHNKAICAEEQDFASLEASFAELQAKIGEQTKSLDQIYATFNKRLPFGLTPLEMYGASTNLSRSSSDYQIYEHIRACQPIMKMTYKELSDAISDIEANKLEELYYNYVQDKTANPIIDRMRENLDISTLSSVKTELTEIQKSRKGIFNTSKHPYYRQVLTYFYEMENEKHLDAAIKLEVKFERDRLGYFKVKPKVIKEKFIETKKAISSYAAEYECLRRVLTDDGYLAVIDNILRGNSAYIKYVHDALDNYISLRDVNKLLSSLDKTKLTILNFAYGISKNYSHYKEIISKIIELRIYGEVLACEEQFKDELGKTVDYENITSRILRYEEDRAGISAKICQYKAREDYKALYSTAQNNKDFLYQISKKQKFWPIRKTMEVYGSFVLSLFPCWLLSPESVSNLLPLAKNMFDIVIFDEASQVFIESTIPSIYRGKNIVVAGDAKQLRPSTAFMKRYLGADIDGIEDYSVQAALEVDSLLDLAVARYDSANLTYHYRSKSEELIAFSNRAFYGDSLQVAPNISRNLESKPIERHKVSGKWVDRKNVAEAKRVVELLHEIFDKREENESVGIITFNADQQTCIADLIDRECSEDSAFRSQMIKERERFEDGEDESIFIKNLENVQGEERDIIIFSIGYAENEQGKVYTAFGSLSADGGENRLNVAITRAKKKIHVVTSIEPEELRVDGSKHLGPKLLKKYLAYARAVSAGNKAEAMAVLGELEAKGESFEKIRTTLPTVEEEMKRRLEKLGYVVDINLGNKNTKISLAVYDEGRDNYLVGIELDRDAFATSDSCIERDICKPGFLESRGWRLIRVWSRDWWLYPGKVIKTITAAAEKAKKQKS